MAESTRQKRMSSLMKEELAPIFMSIRDEVLLGAWATVTTVRVSPDLAIAKVYLSFFQGPRPDAVIERVREHTSQVRRMLGERIRKNVRVVPELSFFLDDSLDYIEHIDELLKR